MAKKTLDRRTVLKGMLATGTTVSIPLPLLEIMLNGNGTALAQTATPVSPLYVTWFFGNGVLPGKWKPDKTGSGSSWSLSSQLMPLSTFKPYMTVISGLENKLVVSGAEHPTGSAGATTGAPLSGNAVKAASIDQVVADLISTGAPFRSLEVGVTPATPNGPQDSLATVSHKGPNARNIAEYDPKAVFNRLFTGGTTTPTTGGGTDQATKLAGVRKSVLDAVLADGEALKKKLGSADKQRVEQHLTSIRAIEQRLATMPSSPDGGASSLPPACGTATAPTTGKDTKSEAPPAVATAMSELSALALGCEKTRVLTYMFSLPAAHVYYRHLASDMNDDFHDTICHGDNGTDSDQPRVDKGVNYAMKCFNEFLTKLQNTPHGAGTLLDATLIYVTSDTAWGKIHTKAEWPVMLVGKGGGRLKGDAHFNYPGDNLSKALLTVAQLMGSKATSYGSGAGQVSAALNGIMP
jgi:hypothetical protein